MLKKILICLIVIKAQASEPKGLINNGNTCFINSALQCLGSIEQLNNFLHDNGSSFFAPDKLASKYSRLAEQMNNSETDIIDLQFFTGDIWSLMGVSARTQQDAQSFLLRLIEKLHKHRVTRFYQEGANSHIPRGMPTDIFYFKLKLISFTNEIAGASHESWDNNLVIPIRPGRLENCLDHYFAREQDDFGNIRQTKLVTLPEILIITIMRFYNNGEKNSTSLPFPLNNLNMQPYLTNNQETLTSYALISLVQHSGNLHSGHYTAYAKRNNNWFYCDDSSITNTLNVRNFETLGRDGNSSSFTPYVLFYKRSSHASPPINPPSSQTTPDLPEQPAEEKENPSSGTSKLVKDLLLSKMDPDLKKKLLANLFRGLELSYTMMVIFPDYIFQLTDLEYLDLSNNMLTRIPEDIEKLVKLKTLILHHNKLKTLPKNISKLVKLENLDVSNNEISALALIIMGLIKLKSLNTLNNPILNLGSSHKKWVNPKAS